MWNYNTKLVWTKNAVMRLKKSCMNYNLSGDMKQPWSETKKKMKLHNSKYVQWHHASEHFQLLMVVLPDLENNQQHRTALEYFRAALTVRWYNLAPIWNKIVTQIWRTYRMKTDSHFNIDYFHMDISLEQLVDTVCQWNKNCLITTQMGMKKIKVICHRSSGLQVLWETMCFGLQARHPPFKTWGCL